MNVAACVEGSKTERVTDPLWFTLAERSRGREALASRGTRAAKSGKVAAMRAAFGWAEGVERGEKKRTSAKGRGRGSLLGGGLLALVTWAADGGVFSSSSSWGLPSELLARRISGHGGEG